MPAKTKGPPRKSTASRRSPPRKVAARKPAAVRRAPRPAIPGLEAGDGELAVEAYVTMMPQWQREVARRLDGIVAREAPAARKAMRRHAVVYAAPGREGFLGLQAQASQVKLIFPRGAALKPRPAPGTSNERAVALRAADAFDEERLSTWVRQAAGAARPTK